MKGRRIDVCPVEACRTQFLERLVPEKGKGKMSGRKKKVIGGVCALVCAVAVAEQTTVREVVYELDAESKTATAVGLGENPERTLDIQKEFWYEKTRYKAIAVAAGAFRGEVAFSKASLDEVRDVGEEAFRDCRRLNQIAAIYAGRLGKSAFEGCVMLSAVSLSAVTNIGERAFAGCPIKSPLNLPRLTDIGKEAFAGCSAASKVKFPCVAQVGEGAFQGCSSITSVRFEQVTNICANAFAGCAHLQTVDFADMLEPPTFGENCFSNVADICVGVISKRAETQNGTAWSEAFARIGLLKIVRG